MNIVKRLKVSTLGFTMSHILGSCEVSLVFYTDEPQVYVTRDTKKEFLHGSGDLDVVIKTGKVITSKNKKIVLTAYEQEFIMKYAPVFEALGKVNADKLRSHILKGE